MSWGTYMPRWMRALRRIAPWLFRKCPGHNWHWRSHDYCHCTNDPLVWCDKLGTWFKFAPERFIITP